MDDQGRRYAEGGNFAFTIGERGVLTCRVWKRPDLDAETGAQLAHEMAQVWERAGKDAAVIAGVFELIDAPQVFGPRTEEAFRAMLTTFSKRIALISGPGALQRLQLQRIIAGHHHAAVVDSPGAALAHVEPRRSSPSASR